MTKEYICELCKKKFNQKIDYTRHTNNKKTACISVNEIKEIIEKKEIKTDNKSILINTFKSCLNILRDNEGLTGEKALRNLSYLLILKLIEPQLDGEINIDNYNYDFSDIEDELIENHKKNLLKIVRFSNLANEKQEHISGNIELLWKDILSAHPSTKEIFLKNKFFDIKHNSTYKKLIDKLNSLDLSKCDYDVLGNAYEEVIQDIMTGKVLGQFFTQPLVKKMMVNLINPQILPDGKIESCCDPTMGTGGFLITYLQYILNQANTKNIKPDWNYIINDGIYGKEIEPDTYQLAVSNMLISSGHMFPKGKLDNGDSIREKITRKFDNVLANPPYGIKGLKYDDINNDLKNDYIPIKSDNAVSLFIQAIIHMLKINGKCAIVLPDGQDLFSKNNKTLISIREYLMKTCDLKEIIYLPSGIFTYTSIKTCVFYFIKKKEGTEILKKTEKSYEFSKTLQTSKVKFYDYNPYEDIKNLLVEVPIDNIVKNAYSLNYSEYIKDESEEKKYEDGVFMKTLGEVCEIDKNLKKYDTSYGKNQGKYKFHTGGERTDLYVDDCDIKELYIIQNRTNGSGKCNLYLDKNFSLAKQTIAYKALNNNEFSTKYIYYYLLYNKQILENGFVGANHKNISKDYISKIKIPIPPLDKQKEIVEYLDFIYDESNKNYIESIENLKKETNYYLNNQKKFGNNSIKTLGDICDFKNGKCIKKDTLINGVYPVIGGGQKPMGYHNEFNTNENTILCSSSGAYAGFISKYNTKVWASDCFSIIPKDNNINVNYLYNNLKILQENIYKLQSGAAQPHVYSKDLVNIKIPIPSLDKQKEIIEYCENNDNLIKQLENKINYNKKLAYDFINSIEKLADKKDIITSDNNNYINTSNNNNNNDNENNEIINEIINEEKNDNNIKTEEKKIIKNTVKKIKIKKPKDE